jgi:hypothetical protein
MKQRTIIFVEFISTDEYFSFHNYLKNKLNFLLVDTDYKLLYPTYPYLSVNLIHNKIHHHTIVVSPSILSYQEAISFLEENCISLI